jgi:putative peptidoglycan lipid II flippase
MRAGRPPSVEAITSAEVLVLGAGTTLGVVAMTACLIPQLRRLGWRFRWRFAPSHPVVSRAARLGAWALGYAGGYQAGLVVVLVLANRLEGGVAAYQWAFTFFYVPHALVAVPIGNVLFPAISEHAARGERGAFVARLRDGLAMLAFLLVPTAALTMVLAVPVASLTLRYGVMTGAGAALVGRVLAAFAAGLPTYSAFLMLTRACYARADTKSPALVNAGAVALSGAVGATLFFALPAGWAVPGLAYGHSLGFAAGSLALGLLLGRRTGSLGSRELLAAGARALAVGAVAALVAAVAHRLFPDASRAQLAAGVVVSAAAGGVTYLGLMAGLRAPEMTRLAALARSWRARPSPGH